jgi:hypothetical protein
MRQNLRFVQIDVSQKGVNEIVLIKRGIDRDRCDAAAVVTTNSAPRWACARQLRTIYADAIKLSFPVFDIVRHASRAKRLQ